MSCYDCEKYTQKGKCEVTGKKINTAMTDFKCNFYKPREKCRFSSEVEKK